MVLMAFVAWSGLGHASTQAERDLFNIKPPHLTAVPKPGEKGIRAHWVRHLFFIGGESKSRERARELKKSYEKCVRESTGNTPIQVVTEWPDFENVIIQDHYISDDGVVFYSYQTQHVDFFVASSGFTGCGLTAFSTHKGAGSLNTNHGKCYFDLNTKKAGGQCRAMPQLIQKYGSPSDKSLLEGKQRPDEIPAVPGAVLMGGWTVTHEIKNILGVPCRVVRGKMGYAQVSLCYAKMGKFQGFPHWGPRPADAVALTLEETIESPEEIAKEVKALAVQSDLVVAPAIFFPFLSPGISIEESAPMPTDLSDLMPNFRQFKK